ncbi:phycocyanobilin lyase [Halobacteriales archaeon QS_1_68_20]|nr:MAG: phycocyanobilin lyase [Halobacteriales archaeon QS_1_68_20]
MSENDDGADEEVDDGEAVTAETIEERLDAAEADLEAADTEAGLDEVEAQLDAAEEDLEAADLPEPDDEDEEDPREELESRLSSLREALEDARGPYAADVAGEVESARSAIAGGEWTEPGVDQLAEAVRSFVGSVEDVLDVRVDLDVDEPGFEDEPHVAGSELDGLQDSLEDAEATVTDAGLDPDEDAETIEALLAAAETLGDEVDAAEQWGDLTVRQKLDAHGYYDVLHHRKDYPPEWGALKMWEQDNRPDMVLLALELQDSDFMEKHCFEALTRMAPEEAVEPMLELAQKRNKDAIRVLGKIGSDEALDTLVDYADAGDFQLRRVTLKAIGEIGSEEATQVVANQLVADDAGIRSQAARSLGLIGDTRAIEPLADVLADDEADRVRASAAWALNRIGTERALDVVADYTDDRAYIVQSEAEKAV